MNAPSHLSLIFSKRNGATRLQIAQQDPPWRVVRAFQNSQGEALVHLHNLSGGLLGGDDLVCNVHVEGEANAQITSSGATRVYRRRTTHGPASQRFNIHVAKGAVLEYVPDQLIPFAGSSYRQQAGVHLESGSGLFWWETLTAGRAAANEQFAYDHLGFSSNIQVSGKPIALERFELNPSTCNISSPLRMASFTCMTTFFICKAGAPPAKWQELESQLTDLAEALTGKAQWGVSVLASDGLIVRGLAARYSDLYDGLIAFWQMAKQSLYGTRAIPPRKVY